MPKIETSNRLRPGCRVEAYHQMIQSQALPHETNERESERESENEWSHGRK